MPYSKTLRLHYQHFQNLKPPRIVFEDGVCYTVDEAILVAKVKSPADLRAIHRVKQIFGGQILKPSEGKDNDQSWFEVETHGGASVQEPDPSPVVQTDGPSLPSDSEPITLNL